MQTYQIDVLPHRLNDDAVIYRGCTMNEMVGAGACSLVASAVLFAIVMQLLVNNFLYGIALGFLVGGALTWLTLVLLERLRRGQEKGYLKQLATEKLEHYGLLKTPIIRRQGYWMIGRDL